MQDRTIANTSKALRRVRRPFGRSQEALEGNSPIVPSEAKTRSEGMARRGQKTALESAQKTPESPYRHLDPKNDPSEGHGHEPKNEVLESSEIAPDDLEKLREDVTAKLIRARWMKLVDKVPTMSLEDLKLFSGLPSRKVKTDEECISIGRIMLTYQAKVDAKANAESKIDADEEATDQTQTRRDRIKEAMLRKKEQEKRKRAEEKVPEDERIFWSVVKHWNKQPNLRKHIIKSNLSKTLRTAKKLISEALKGKLNIDHEMCVENKKYNLRDFMKGIDKLNKAAGDPAVGMKTNRWASQQSLSSFILNPVPIECSDPDGEFAFRNMSPFMFFIDNDLGEQEMKKIAKASVDSADVDKVYEQLIEQHNACLTTDMIDTPSNRKIAERMTPYFIKFIKENDYGLDKGLKKVRGLAAEYFFWYFGKQWNPKLEWIDSARSKDRFFEYMVSENFLVDDRDGETFSENDVKGLRWFQLSQNRRDEILKEEAAERQKRKEVDERINERLRKEVEEKKAQELPVPTTNPLEKTPMRVLKDQLRSAAKKAGKQLEFDKIWLSWVRETKSDEQQFAHYRKQIDKLLK